MQNPKIADMSGAKVIEFPVQGMDCAECTTHVRNAIRSLEGIHSVEVYLAAEKAVVDFDPEKVQLAEIQKAVATAGYKAVIEGSIEDDEQALQKFARPVLVLTGVVFVTLLLVVVVGEWLGLFEAVTGAIPWPVSLAAILLLGYPVFKKVALAARRGQVISHTLMSLGVIAAVWIGEWATAAVVVFFMRVGDFTERYTTERARRAVKDLAELAPRTARIERGNSEEEIPISQVRVGEIAVVRPGEKIPVDGFVLSGHGTVDQSAITGESMPAELGTGSKVYASTMLSLGSLRIRTDTTGENTTFGGIIRLVQQAEGNRARVQLIADRFSTYYLPVVAGVAVLTYLLRGDAQATAAVLVVACSCAFTLATPIAMLASIGAAARGGVMVKGGKYLEALEKVDTVLLDKTGTLTLGKPRISDIIPVNGGSRGHLQAYSSNPDSVEERCSVLRMAASAERYSEHPLAAAMRAAAHEQSIELTVPQDFCPVPGVGVTALVDGLKVEVSNLRRAGELVGDPAALASLTADLEKNGKTLSFLFVNERLAGILAAEDTLRPDVPQALLELHDLGIKRIELLTGDHHWAAESLLKQVQRRMQELAKNDVLNLELTCHAELLPEDKIAIVRQHQAQGRNVAMVGDGVNDAPALAQADVGVAMGAAGSPLATEAAHIALMREDWRLVPEIFRVSRRTMRVVRGNIAFTAVYNLAGLALTAFGLISPIFAAAMQSLPDLGILANSSRLLRQKPRQDGELN